jgi:isocitrate/isopropylmalate dehydrogenase
MFVTPDLGGKAKTIEMAQAIISKLWLLIKKKHEFK